MSGRSESHWLLADAHADSAHVGFGARLLGQRIALSSRLLPISAVANVGLALILCLEVPSGFGRLSFWLWLCMVAFGAAARIALIARRRNITDRVHASGAMLRAFTVLGLVDGLGLAFYASGLPLHEGALHAGSLGVAGAAVSTALAAFVVPIRRAFLLLLVPAWIAFAGRMAWQPDFRFTLGAIAVSLAFLAGLAMLLRLHEFMHAVMRDRLLNAARNEQLYQENLSLMTNSEEEARRHRAMQVSDPRAETHSLLHIAQCPLAIIDWDCDLQVVGWNPSAEKVFGHTATQALGQSALSFLLSDVVTDHVREVWGIVRAQQISVRSCNENIARDGRTLFCEWFNTPIKDAVGAVIGYSSIVQDITQRRQEEEAIHRMAYHDILTGLPNRALMNDRLDQTLKQARRNRTHAAVLFLDLDHFKTINDTLGHAQGDELLRQVASTLAEAVREGDTVARLGGDEFVVILSDLYLADDAKVAAEKLLRALARPVLLGEQQFEVTTSIGVSIYPDHGAQSEVLLKHADMAMYRAKSSGRNNIAIFSPDLTGTTK